MWWGPPRQPTPTESRRPQVPRRAQAARSHMQIHNKIDTLDNTDWESAEEAGEVEGRQYLLHQYLVHAHAEGSLCQKLHINFRNTLTLAVWRGNGREAARRGCDYRNLQQTYTLAQGRSRYKHSQFWTKSCTKDTSDVSTSSLANRLYKSF